MATTLSSNTDLAQGAVVEDSQMTGLDISELTKVCSKCGHEKPLSAFSRHKGGVHGRRPDCKKCKGTKDWARVKNDPAEIERRRAYNKRRNATNKEERRQRYLEQRSRDPEAMREAARARYRRRGGIPEHTKAKQRISKRQRAKERRATDPAFKMFTAMRTRIQRAMVRGSARKDTNSAQLLGCSARQFRLYLENLWQPGMSWNNYGNGPRTWQVDHIIPCASFDLSDSEQQRRCFHWSNCRPLWTVDNNSKKAQLPSPDLATRVHGFYERWGYQRPEFSASQPNQLTIMATILGTSDYGPLVRLRRTWRTTIESQTQQPVVITAHREELWHTADGTLVRQDQSAGAVRRSLSDVVAETVTLTDGTVLSALQVAEAVERFLEQWDAEDLTPPAALDPLAP